MMKVRRNTLGFSARASTDPDCCSRKSPSSVSRETTYSMPSMLSVPRSSHDDRYTSASARSPSSTEKFQVNELRGVSVRTLIRTSTATLPRRFEIRDITNHLPSTTHHPLVYNHD